MKTKIEELKARLDALEKEARHFERQCQMLIHHHEHVDGMVQQHEAAIFELQVPHDKG